jgi:hypothetical protein
MRSNNHNEAITNLAVPERRIPVLIESSAERAEGFVPSIVWSGKPVTPIQRLQPSFIDGMGSPGKRREIEKEYGAISAVEWNRLRNLLDLKDRMNAGDRSPIVTSNAKEALAHWPALLDKLSPGGWSIEEDKAGVRTYRSASGDVQARISFSSAIEIEPWQASLKAPVVGTLKAAPRIYPASKRDRKILDMTAEISAAYKPISFALSEAFTAGLSKTRFVVWWFIAAKKFVPGLYCPDIVTALYALAMWSSGTPGGWAICQNRKCGKDYPRSRTKQRYCSHKCQVAAAMRRMRDKKKRAAAAEAKLAPKTKKRTGRK